MVVALAVVVEHRMDLQSSAVVAVVEEIQMYSVQQMDPVVEELVELRILPVVEHRMDRFEEVVVAAVENQMDLAVELKKVLVLQRYGTCRMQNFLMHLRMDPLSSVAALVEELHQMDRFVVAVVAEVVVVERMDLVAAVVVVEQRQMDSVAVAEERQMDLVVVVAEVVVFVAVQMDLVAVVAVEQH